mmetsp:Transcript_12453/g.34966  ORF Transcript_12453/g.34966 Transcript_12453/m.34966 type:complete len:285 (-) Transcript_12453:1201-2055(-)
MEVCTKKNLDGGTYSRRHGESVDIGGVCRNFCSEHHFPSSAWCGLKILASAQNPSGDQGEYVNPGKQCCPESSYARDGMSLSFLERAAQSRVLSGAGRELDFPAARLSKICVMSSNVVPIVSGTANFEKARAATDTQKKTKNAPPGPSPADIGTKTSATVPLVRRFNDQPMPTAVPLMRGGNTSARRTPVSGPHPTLNEAMKTHRPAAASAGMVGDAVKATASISRPTATPTDDAVSRGRRPILSMVSRATPTNTALHSPTAAVTAYKTFPSMMPMLSSTVGVK